MVRKMIRILCVDDHAFVVDGLRARFELENDLECVGRLATADNLVEEVRNLRPDIIMLDIEMPGTDPFDQAEQVKRRFPDSRVIFLSAYVRDNYISAAFRAGAWGYFSKGDEAATIIDGIRKVVRGEFAFGPAVEERCQPSTRGRGRATARGDRSASTGLKPPKSKLDALTPREHDVLRLIGKGHTRSDIAKLLHRSPKTIDGHRESIMQKLDIHDRGELVRFAIREGVVEP